MFYRNIDSLLVAKETSDLGYRHRYQHLLQTWYTTFKLFQMYLEHVFHSIICKDIDSFKAARKKLFITLFIRRVNDPLKYSHLQFQCNPTISKCKKSFLQSGCFCSNDAVAKKSQKPVRSQNVRWVPSPSPPRHYHLPPSRQQAFTIALDSGYGQTNRRMDKPSSKIMSMQLKLAAALGSFILTHRFKIH